MKIEIIIQETAEGKIDVYTQSHGLAEATAKEQAYAEAYRQVLQEATKPIQKVLGKPGEISLGKIKLNGSRFKQ
jgi:hypothetical protein